MTTERVEAAIGAIRRGNEELGRWAEWAADSLTAGDGEEIISQASLQSFLWYYLPKKSSEDVWAFVAEGAAALLDELGLSRYANIARSEVTAEVLDAWRADRAKGFRRFNAAMNASGVAPVDTELLAWGDVMGGDEASAISYVESALEAAIVSGEMTPGAKGWMQIREAVCMRAIREPVHSVPTQSWLTLVVTERVANWVDAGRSERLRSWRRSIANSVLAAPEPPEELQSVTGAMAWLLDVCKPGVELTQAGYLPPRLVAEAIQRFFQEDTLGKPRSEIDVHHLLLLRETASRMGLVAKRRRLLKTSRAGLRLLDDPVALWRAIAANLHEGDAYSRALSELIAHRLLQGPAVGSGWRYGIVPIVLEQGWSSGGAPVTALQVENSVHVPLYYWRLFGLLNERRPRWEGGRSVGEYVTELTPAGHATALALLHACATGPRKDLFG